jgi:DNA-binding beta-propeller fold protein YncE
MSPTKDEPVGAWDLSYFQYSPPGAFDLSNWSADSSTDISNEETSAQGLTFSPDGTRMYLVGTGNKSVYQYDLSVPWRTSTRTYVGMFTVANELLVPSGVDLSHDGTKMYLVGYYYDTVFEYTLYTPWDVSTASLNQSLDISADASTPMDLVFKHDGTKMYISEYSNNVVLEYDLSVPWDISTGTLNYTLDLSLDVDGMRGATFSPDGTHMYIVSSEDSSVNQYSLSTPWDTSTASHVYTLDMSGLSDNLQAVYINPSGAWLMILMNVSDVVYTLKLSAEPDISGYDGGPRSVFFRENGNIMYIVGTGTTTAYLFTMSTEWDHSDLTYLSSQDLDLSSYLNSPYDMYWSPDGVNLYFVCEDNNEVHHFTTSSSWVFSETSYQGYFSIGSEISYARGLHFSPDGTMMFVLGATYVHKYSLSAPWDISTVSYTNEKVLVQGNESYVTCIFFSTSGHKMYIGGVMTDSIECYELSTRWDLTTATLTDTVPIGHIQGMPLGFYFSPDGTYIYVVGSDGFVNRLKMGEIQFT